MIQLALRLDDRDPWIAVGAAEALGQRGDKVKGVLAQLTAATAATRPPAVRAAALVATADVWLAAALEPATRMAADTSRTVRLAAAGVRGRRRVGGKEGLKKLLADRDPRVRGAAQRAYLELADTVPELPARRAARRAAFASPDAVVRAAAASSMKAWADSADVPVLLEAYARYLVLTSSQEEILFREQQLSKRESDRHSPVSWLVDRPLADRAPRRRACTRRNCSDGGRA